MVLFKILGKCFGNLRVFSIGCDASEIEVDVVACTVLLWMGDIDPLVIFEKLQATDLVILEEKDDPTGIGVCPEALDEVLAWGMEGQDSHTANPRASQPASPAPVQIPS
nr:putative anion transporter 7 [Ipomoea batatas]